MSKRRDRLPIPSQPSTNLSQDSPSPYSSISGSPSTLFPSSPVSASSPSFTGFLSKPSKWFSRPSLIHKNSSPSPESQRVRTTSTVRRAAISGPTDPRPLIPLNTPKPIEVKSQSSQSVLDLTLTSNTRFIPEIVDLPQHDSSALKSISRKTWSRSVDDLSSLQGQHSMLTNPPIRDESLAMQTKAKIEAYRNNTANVPFPFPSSQTAPPSPVVSPGRVDIGNNSVTFPQTQHSFPNVVSSTVALSENPKPPRTRNRTMSSFLVRDHDIDKGRSVPIPAPGSQLQANPPVTFSSKHNAPSTSTTLPDPALKRSSQISQFSGFLNRHTGSNAYSTFRSSHALNSVLSKGWKSYKAVLKGSKLYFYKPPSDKNLEIKELFPQGVNPMLPELPQPVESVEGGPEGPAGLPEKKRDEVRKRARVYRGRNTHPELGIKTNGFPTRGTLDALLHEAIFGTCFRANSDLSTLWRSFSSCMLMCLPRLMGRETFEDEFIRYASSFVSEAEDHEQELTQGFISWLSGLYIALYNYPVNERKWDAFKSSIKYSDDHTVPFGNVRPFPSQQNMQDSAVEKSNDAEFATDDFTDDRFLTLDPEILAQSLAIFHLRAIPRTYNASFSVDLLDYALDNEKNSLSPQPFACFFGSDEAPHWLSRFIVARVLNPNTRSSDVSPDVLQVSKTHVRSELIAHWIMVAEHCRSLGDRCTWKAIEAALCSRPLARLEKVWRRISLTTLRLFHSWAKDTDSPDLAIMTPWGGDITKITSLWPKAKIELRGRDDVWDADTLLKISDYNNSIQDQFSRSTLELDSRGQDEVAMPLVKIWQNIQSQGSSKFRTFEDFISQSFAAEPRLKGWFEVHHWQRGSHVAATQSILPLSFVEPLPTLSLVDRDHFQRGKKDGHGIDGSYTQVHQTRVPQLFSLMAFPNGDELLDVILPNIADGSGLVIPLYDGDLLVEVPERLLDIPSRPSSIFESNLERRPSQVRVTNGGFGRKPSIARRGSLPVLPQPDILSHVEQPSESSLRAIVKAGTLDRLVDVLLFGLDGISVSVADDNGEAPLRKGKTRLLKLDREIYQTSWWAIFRSFVTPYVLFELLRKRAILAMSSAKTRRAVLITISDWIEKGGGIQDALNDSELFRALSTFLNTPVIGSDGEMSSEWASLEVLRQQVASVLAERSRRPQLYASPLSQSLTDPHPVNYGNQPPSLDNLDPETLVDNLDALAATAMRSVTLDDLIVAIDVLETQSADRIGWFLSHESSLNSDEIEIQTIYSHLQQVQSSILLSEDQDSLYKLLPPSIRGLIRAHAVIRKYLLSKIVTPRLGLRIRQTRMETLLRTIEVCRLRTTDHSSIEIFMNQRSARSFVETAVVSAIIAPESRFFSVAWNSVALARGTTADSLESLLSTPMVQSVASKSRLTIDIGWLLERFLEVISIPNLIDSDVEGSTLINMGKRHYLHDLASLSLSLRLSRPRKLQNVLDRSDTERLNNMHRQVTGPAFDNRLLRDEAYHESLNGVAHSRKSQRPFAKVVLLQQEKCKRDRIVRERLGREKKAEQLRSDKREEDINRAMHSGRPNALSLKNQRSRRTMSSAFLQLMRPISSAFISGDQPDSSTTPIQRRTAQELDFEPTAKPSLVISLAGATVKNFINTVRLYLFHIVTEDGGRYLLQAPTRSELESWMSCIGQTAKLTSAKRLTYIGNSTRPIVPQDQIEIPSQMGLRHPKAVFNVELDVLLQREAGNNQIVVGAVPQILERCLAEIEARGLQEPGLYRVPGASSAINTLRTQFDTGQEITFFDREYVDIFAICDVVKTWLRALPQAIFPEKSYQEAIQVIQIQDFEARLKAVRKVIHELPVNSMYLLRRVCEHLDRVTDYEEQNQMTAEALAVVFNPSLLRSPTNDFGLLMQNMKYTSQLLQVLITHFHRVFDEGDVEQDDEADGDMSERTENVTIQHTELWPPSPAPTDVFHDHDVELEHLPISRIGNAAETTMMA